MNCRNLILIISLLIPFVGRSEVKWLETEYNYGAFKEAEGPRKGIVRFVNVGKDATFINSVRPSCGCTAAAYTEDMIQPGDTATVEFIYNPAGRPGPFDKTVKVYLGKENDLKVIRIYGTVIGAPETLETNYPYLYGPLRFETISQGMGEVKKGSSRHVFVNVYNQGNDTVVPEISSSSPALEVDFTPKRLAPGEIGTLGFYLNTTKERNLGPVDYRVTILPEKGEKSDACKIDLQATIVPDTRAMSVEEIEAGPSAYLVPEFVDFGENVGGEKIPFEFEILNDGKSTLEVMKVYSYDKSVDITDVPKKIKAGKTAKVKGNLDSKGIPSGAFRIQVDVVTNDLLHPLRTANLVGVKI